jgi:hypothetical protein
MVITEDGIVDYITCPLRYCFLWHYEVESQEPRYLYRQYVRTGLSAAFKLLHRRQLTLKTLQTEMRSRCQGLTNSAWPFLESVITRYAAEIKDYQVVAYDLPTIVDVGGHRYVGCLDVLFIEGGSLVAAHVDDLPSYVTDSVRRVVNGVVQHGAPQVVLEEAEYRGLPVSWRSLVLRGGGMQSSVVPETALDTDYLTVLGHDIENWAFSPRYHRSSCRNCGFSPVCNPKWALPERLRVAGIARRTLMTELEHARDTG